MKKRPPIVIKRSDAARTAPVKTIATNVPRRPSRNMAATIGDWIIESRELRRKSTESDLIALDNLLTDVPVRQRSNARPRS